MSSAPNISVIIPIAPNETSHQNLLNDLKNTAFDIIISSEGNRADSLNIGARKAKHDILWFLHADSRVHNGNIRALEKSLTLDPSSLHYFYLAYDEKGLTSLSAIAANIRSRLFGLPYGDQGFCISKDQFKKIGGYPNAPYGEDLLLIRLAKRINIKIKPVSSKLQTSARKYKEIGWFKLTALRQIQMWKLIRKKL